MIDLQASLDVHDHAPALVLGQRLSAEVLAPMKRLFVGKDEVIDLLGVALVAGENLFILGPPGTAKSALVMELARGIHGQAFDYLLTRFTEPNELFGPFDIRRLREGELVTNTEGMLPEATLVFLDELLNANSAILNSLLMVLNERVFRRGRETRRLPTLLVVGASNRLPEDDALHALFDRFLLRVHCDNVPGERLHDVLEAGWQLAKPRTARIEGLSSEDIRLLQESVSNVDLAPIRTPYVELVHRLRHAGIPISDRRAVKLQRPVAASALLCGRTVANLSDLWVLRYIWDTEEQQEVLASIVGESLRAADTGEVAHPQAKRQDHADPESLARELDALAARLESGDAAGTHAAYLQDRLSVLSARCQWVESDTQRQFLEEKADGLWKHFGGKK